MLSKVFKSSNSERISFERNKKKPLKASSNTRKSCLSYKNYKESYGGNSDTDAIAIL